MSKVYVGTSGYSYKHWQGRFYPQDLSEEKWLAYYVEKLQSVELNNTFYNLPNEHTAEKWREEAPEGFVFSVKASRYITHLKKLKDSTEPVENFLGKVKQLKEKLGPILFQLPPHWKPDIGRLDKFTESLPDGYRYVFEFRDHFWNREDVYRLLEDRGMSFCIFELAGHQSPLQVTSELVYVRLHGPADTKYEGEYNDKDLEKWCDRINQWQKEKKEVFLYFDNDQNAYAAKNAIQLRRMLNN